jgi:putative ABC transport system permease protein
MAMLNKLRLRLRALFFKPKMEDELQAELQFHLEREIEENIARRMTPEDARYAAIRSFGVVERVKEESRDVRGIRLLEEVWQDLRVGARMLLKQPGFTLIAVVTLALGIGANTAIFSVVNALLFKPLPYPGSERLMQLYKFNTARERENPMWEYPKSSQRSTMAPSKNSNVCWVIIPAWRRRGSLTPKCRRLSAYSGGGWPDSG